MSTLRWSAAAVLAASRLALAQDPPPAAAAPPPSADEIKRVLEYQDNGKDRGPALLDVVPCLKVDQTKGSPTQFTCIEPVTGAVKKNTTVNAWVQFFCPKGGKYEDLKIQWLLGNEVRQTTDITVEGLARTRTWRAHTPPKAGKWTIKIIRGESTELGSATFTVEN
ncbi:MAG: hypothetical protein SFW67_28850 [Myxococcaceae bacterium]|nr:hypothetical protein [Myxococcaceae bacterium]